MGENDAGTATGQNTDNGTLLAGDDGGSADDGQSGGATGDAGTGDGGSASGSADGGSGGDVGSRDSSSDDWKATLGDLASNEKLANFKSVQELAQAVIDAPEPVQVPESYTVPEGVQLDDDILGTFKTLNLSQKQVDGLMKLNADRTNAAFVAADEAQKRDLETLKKSLGEEFEPKVRLARQAIAKIDTDGKLKQFLQKTRAGNNAIVIQAMMKVGELLKEGGFVSSESHSTSKGPKSMAERIYPNQGKGN